MPRIVNDGVAIHYRVEGRGFPLILQHGFTDSSESWYELGYVEALKSKYHLILPDTRGHGQSDKPHELQAYTRANFAADIAAVLDDAGVHKALYWGYSQGGAIGFALAQFAPQRLAGLVIGGAASAGSAFPTEPGKEDPLLAVLGRGLGELVKATRLMGEWVTPALEQRLLANDTAALIACRQERLTWGTYSHLIGNITVPTLLYSGTSDPIHGPAQQTASKIPGAKFISLPNLNHMAAAQPQFILRQVEEFLEKVL
jgi:pimeloyl-ACP methyl ester carboxylesterase